jgi:hypothetical protein
MMRRTNDTPRIVGIGEDRIKVVVVTVIIGSLLLVVALLASLGVFDVALRDPIFFMRFVWAVVSGTYRAP